MIASVRSVVDYATRGAAPSRRPARALVALTRWWRTYRDRRTLGSLSDHMLRDLGLTRADIEREAAQPFWRPVDYGALDQQRALAARRTVRPEALR